MGRQVARHAHAAAGHLRAIESLAANADPPRLRIGAVASALVRLVPGALARFRREWPAARVLSVQGDDDELAAWLAAETVDLVVTTRPIAGAGREIVDEFLAVLPRDHRLGRDGRAGLAELADAGLADPGGTCAPVVAAHFAAHGVDWRPDHLVRDVATALAMAEAGITAGVAPAMAVPSPPPPGVRLMPLDPPLHRTVYACHRPDDTHAGAFAQLLTA
ncbi:LysR family transcriptional regulator substrate-binding protein [Amycolatopsis sp. NBC_00345]|uniref:LysR family transcriptional regulator substrate-binding protein n=1 Tax=Amycolatopsis sp. NBC_00345 TaxID=2975955 RepID=UPI002E26A7ED